MPLKVILLFLTLLSACDLRAGGITETISPSELAWSYRGRTVLAYAFGTNQFKPYVRELYSLKGDNVLRDAPADHLHHHGLMYAIRVNGVNFWEENDRPGYQKSIGLVSHRTGTNSAGLPEASFTQRIHWVAETDKEAAIAEKAALLIEERTLTLTVDEASDEIALQWNASFTAATSVTLGGTRYNGLGLRFPESFDHVAEFKNFSGKIEAKKTEQIFPSTWAAISGPWHGRNPTVALFAAESNTGDSAFFAMAEPFAYLSATQQLEKRPLEYAADQTFALRYLVLTYSGRKDAESLAARFERWKRDNR